MNFMCKMNRRPDPSVKKAIEQGAALLNRLFLSIPFFRAPRKRLRY